MKNTASTCTLSFAIALWSSAACAVQVHVPFVGCPADGQAGPLAAPTGKARVIRLDEPPPGPIAFYKGAQGFGVFAPAGWNCRVWYGSAGGSLIVTPKAIVPPYFPAPSFAPPVIEMSGIDGGTSGRFEVARLGAMLFPDLTKSYREKIEGEGILPREEMRSDIEVRKYPTDSLTYITKRVVEFQTPANTKGLGTEGRVKTANTPIEGAVVLYGKPVGAAVLRASLGTKYQSWSPIILQLNMECMKSPNGC